MAEENQSTVHAETEVKHLQELVRLDPSLANDPEIKGALESASALQQQKAKDNAGTETTQKPKEDIFTKTDEKSTNDEEEEEEEEEEDDADEQEDVDDPNDIFGVSKSSKPKQKVKLDFEPQKEIVELFEKKYGIKDVPTFLNSVDTWREQAQEGAKAKADYEQIVADINELPPTLFRAVLTHAEGGDWTKVVTEERLDYSKPFEKQNVDGLVQQYFADEYNEEKKKLDDGEISQDEFNRSIKLLGSTTKKLFEKDKGDIEKQRVQFEENQKKKFQAIKTSALDSVKSLSKTYPHFKDSELKRIENILVNGEAEDLLFKSDGTYKDDVAESIAYVMYGKKLMEQIKKSAERIGESKAREDVVDTSDKKLKQSKGNDKKSQPNTDAIKHLMDLVPNDPFANRMK